MRARFKPAWWCRGPHCQTLWPYLFRRVPHVELRRERLELPDGDFLDLDWTDVQGRTNAARDRMSGAASTAPTPIVIILHGLEGSSDSKYARGLLMAIRNHGGRGVVLHFRGCSGVSNRLPRSYHSGETTDLAYVVDLLRRREPEIPLFVVGFSLGGNVLLKWLGALGAQTPVNATVAVSVPFLLAESANRLNRGFSRVYQWSLMRRMRATVATKRRRMALPLKIQDLSALKSFWDFDEHVTAPLHGFVGAEEYYARSSSRQYLKGIQIPTLIIQSRDDPFMTDAVIPRTDELSPAIEFALYDHGGHVGFVAGDYPWRPEYWLEERILQYLLPSRVAP